jgi:hypothetical protein
VPPIIEAVDFFIPGAVYILGESYMPRLDVREVFTAKGFCPGFSACSKAGKARAS